MGKLHVASVALTPADRVRDALSRAESRIANVRKAGPDALEALYLLDEAAAGLHELRRAGMDVRAEEARFETLQRQFKTRRAQFAAEVGPALKEHRELVHPDPARWWWFVDQQLAEERSRRLRQVLIGVGAAAVVLVIAWFLYDRFIAPPPYVRQAMSLAASGESAVDSGDLEAALSKFEEAVQVNPDEPDHWVWLGVTYSCLGREADAQGAFDRAKALYESDRQFLLSRSMRYLRFGQPEAAIADANQAIAEYPEDGWAYVMRANAYIEQNDYQRGLADLDKAAELASLAGDAQLEGYARTQRAMVIQLQAAQPFSTPSATQAAD